MRAAAGIVTLSVLLAIAAPGAVRSQQPPTVTIQDFEFRPATQRVTAGSQVRWVNNGPSTHTVTADRGAFDAGRVSPGGTFSFTFNSAGTFEYHCEIHRSMRGQIVVEPASSDPGYDY